METLKRINEESVQSLREKLQNAGIDISKWGTGQAKTLEHLQKEIEEGETVLIIDDKGEILRELKVGIVEVYYINEDGKTYYLKEEKQIFNDGRERRRELEGTIFEKIKFNENPKDSIIRGISEELGINGDLNLEEKGIDEHTNDSLSYPNLRSHYITYNYKLILNVQQFDPKGYIENQPDKKTYFLWKEI